MVCPNRKNNVGKKKFGRNLGRNSIVLYMERGDKWEFVFVPF